jgi:NAD dependent epimerase/dehydratase family enzyme
MSTTHIYGDPPSETCDENSIFGYGLAPTVAKAWEEAHIDYIPKGIRSVILRTSFVISKNGGALPRLERLTRLGLGGKISHGNQGISWIHYSDMNRIFRKAIESEEMCGAFIASSPYPVSNKVFMRELRNILNVRIGLPATTWMVKIGAPLIMKTDPELALYGRYCIPTRLSNQGFTFTFPHLNQALNNIYNPQQ